ncbi:ATP-binding protein [Ferruginibacter sp. HRS2-29]|uniref:ATP-binding protein n=1 Tax=Ferruginibacter sp. HRS2-29 TaxID=2487334 RepID=UPI0020CC29D5|nr:ATP-binding protein [Ferruginibacter sp. HRS2-29]
MALIKRQRLMQNKSTLFGIVQDVKGTTVSVNLTNIGITGLTFVDGEGYRIGQIGSFAKIPIGYSHLFGIISQVGASAVPENQIVANPYGNRWATIQLIGEGYRNGRFERGIAQYPTIGDEVHLVSEDDLKNIYGKLDKPYFVKVGHIAGADSIPALVDINKLITRHSAVLGTTGSGKSTTVAGLLNAISEPTKYPSSRVIVFDLHGEYGTALKDRANIYKINTETTTNSIYKNLYIPFWALNFDELIELILGQVDEKDKAIIGDKILSLKRKSATDTIYDGINLQRLSVDTPIPFSLNRLWLHLQRMIFSTHTTQATGQCLSNIEEDFDIHNTTEAFAIDNANIPLQTGDAELILPPQYKSQVAAQIFLSGSNLNIRRQLEGFTSKLRNPIYDFLFSPGDWKPDINGIVSKDLDDLFGDWLGSDKPITILDLSGIPNNMLNTIIAALLRIIYEGLFWARNLSQGGRSRPLLLVMEEAHNYLNDSIAGSALAIVQRIVKEGRKYGIGTMIVSQRPSEINSTILSQCGTFFALRLTNSNDRSHVTSVVSDNLDGLVNMLPILRTGEAIVLGEAVKLPMRAIIDVPPKDKRPDSQDPIVYDELLPEDSMQPGGWGIKMEQNPNYKEFVETWRSQNPIINKVKQ